jgi:hypothetical protein
MSAPWAFGLLEELDSWLAPFSFSSTAFTFSQRTAHCDPLGIGVSLDLAGERKKYTVAYKIELLCLSGPLP